ncbi:MAG: hypothetical protein ACEPOV_14375 [Hyphomicrobiales bacterium]
MKRVYLVFLLLAGLYSCKKDFTEPETTKKVNQKSQVAYNLNNWMQDIYSTHRDVKYNEMVIPSAHDAATYKISMDSDWAKEAEWYKKLGGKRPAYFWSFTTRKSIYELLQIGVRNFDIRLEYNGRGWYSYHGLLSTNFHEILDDFKRFFSEHPKELVHIELRADQMNEGEYRAMMGLWLNDIGANHILKKGDGLTPQSTIGQYWDKGINMVLSCSRDAESYKDYTWQNFWVATWAGSDKAQNVMDYIINNIKTRPMDKIYTSSFTQTPSSDVIVHGAFAKPKSLEDLCCQESKWGAVNTKIDEWLPKLAESAYASGKKVNIITLDFPEFNNNTKKIVDWNFVQLERFNQ